MKIDTDDYITIADACAKTTMSPATFYRAARRLGLEVVIFGAKVVRKADVRRIEADKRPIGNPLWINSTEAASKAAMKAVRSRLRRIKEDGMTDAELNRGERISKARASKR
jgi:hypothetical protein